MSQAFSVIICVIVSGQFWGSHIFVWVQWVNESVICEIIVVYFLIVYLAMNQQPYSPGNPAVLYQWHLSSHLLSSELYKHKKTISKQQKSSVISAKTNKASWELGFSLVL